MNHMTALVSCFARAYHTRMNEVRIFSDEAAYPLLCETYEEIAQHMMQGVGFFLPGFSGSPEEGLRLVADRQLSPSVLGRSAFCEEMLEKSREGGCGQYLLLASGYDTFGIRNTDASLKVFEADLPEVLADKKERAERAGLKLTSIFVPCDLSDPSWRNALMEKGYDEKREAFVGMLGISYYLEKEAFHSLLKTLYALLVPGSGICFDVPCGEAGRESRMNEDLARAAEEVMQERYDVSELIGLLRKSGFEIKALLGPKEMTDRYFSHYNSAMKDHWMEAPRGVYYVFAVRKDGKE